MKVNPNYLGRLFTENELTEEERSVGGETSSNEKGERETFLSTIVIVLF